MNARRFLFGSDEKVQNGENMLVVVLGSGKELEARVRKAQS